ncbi:MAG: xanthine dehydrogenase family protein molybdopterin-binding subunit [Caldilineaceae bacterium]|nr:xanthine dehydrogenase family protein molybdopterin-binding subunit [Caldilineaceae bacterium]
MPINQLDLVRAEDDDKQSLQVVEETDLTVWGQERQFQSVGKRHSRVDGPEKVTGRARYSYDIRLPGQLYAKVLRSPHPHARITRIDTSKAERLNGVHAVLSSANVSDEITFYEEESPLFSKTVRFVGDEVAAVAAASEEIAEDALRLIEVEYEPLPFVVEMEKALAPGAPHIHAEGNRAAEKKSERGNVERGFAEADVIVDEVYVTEVSLHNAFEPHGCTTHWQGDQLIIYESTQGIFGVRDQVAEKLGLPTHKVRVIKQYMGGGFGAKQIVWKQTIIAALLAKASGRPVQLMLDREAENLATGNRNATRQHIRIGAKRDGTLTALEVEVRQSVGAYMVGGEASDVISIYQHLYRCPNLRAKQTGVYINAGPSVAFRAPGYVEGCFGLESAIDQLARELGIDPLDLRLRNYTGEDQEKDLPYSSPESLRASYERASEAFGWRTYRKPQPQGSRRRGIGLAAHEWAAGSGSPPAYAWIKLNGDGSADVITGSQDIGTGTRTGLAQVAAEELGLPMESITLYLGDTALGPYAPTSSGSATLPSLAPAIREAAINVKDQLCKAASQRLEEDPSNLRVENGEIFAVDDQSTRVSVAEICAAIAPHMIQGQGRRGPNPEDKSVRTFGVQCAEVEVDVETGEVTILRVVASHDCGRIVNPKMVDSQVIGGITQAIGFAMTEERIIDVQSGVVLNPNLEDYKIPTIMDIPPITHAAVDLPDLEANSTGIKGVGEPPIVPTAPAIANAIFDAVGVRLRKAPFTRRDLVNGLRSA